MQQMEFRYAPIRENSVSKRCQELQEKTIQFSEQHVRPHLPVITESRKVPDKLMDELRKTGWFGLMIDRRYGGMGLDCLHRVVNVEHLARECPDFGAILQIAQLGTGSILEFGSEEQKLRWLPEMASGERICTISITEENSGSHVLGMDTSFEESKDGFVLNGEKSYIGNCGIANLHVVYARDKHGKNISAFIVPGETEGVENSVAHHQTGLRAFPFGKLKLDNVYVPRQNQLGQAGDGLKMAYYVIGHHGRPSLTALALGIHRRILDLSYSFSMQRNLYGKPISELPDVRNKIFDVYCLFEQSRQMAYEAAEQMNAGENAYRALSLAKFLSGDHVCKAANIAAEIFGARAGLPEFEIAQLYLDAMMTRPPSGTGDVQKKRIMDDLLSTNPIVTDLGLQKGAA